mmetsp:Transcript_29086/g.32626  ORF Transcript_29086/g.32626 Transcript_29086/m.32626 type:complete len:86 (+) Transcript_29086:24-281(+)
MNVFLFTMQKCLLTFLKYLVYNLYDLYDSFVDSSSELILLNLFFASIAANKAAIVVAVVRICTKLSISYIFSIAAAATTPLSCCI